jgi:hypothetical protein
MSFKRNWVVSFPIALLVALATVYPLAAFYQSRDSNYNIAIAAGGGGTPFSLVLTDTMVDNTGSSTATFTFTTRSLGTADSTRQMIAAVSLQPNGGVVDPASVTIGGVSATLVASSNSSSGVTDVSQWIASVPAGATGSVVVSMGGNTALRATVGLYALYGAGSGVKGAATSAGSASSQNHAFNFTSYGTIVAVGGGFSNGSFSGTNLTLDQDDNVSSVLGLGSLSNVSVSGSTTFTVNWGAVQTISSSFVAYGQ